MNARQLLLTSLATLVIFVAGIGTGHRLARTNVLPPPSPHPTQPQPGGMPMMGRVDMFARMVRELNLDPMQRQQINRLITERQEYLAEVVRRLEPDLRDMMPKLRRDVNEILRPEQRQELERRFTERIKRDNSGMRPEPRRQPQMRESQSELRPTSDFRPEGARLPPRSGPNPNRPTQPPPRDPDPRPQPPLPQPPQQPPQ